MHETDIRALIARNSSFYRDHAASFSATRGAPWQGWRRVADALASTCGARAGALDVLDVACGNERFSRFMADALPGASVRYLGIDNCDALAQALAATDGPSVPSPDGATTSHAAPDPTCSRLHRDLLASLLDGRDPLADLASFDLVACFGFMHHVPDPRLRRAVMRSLVKAVRPGGIIAISFWQFMGDERLAAKARAVTERARQEEPALALEESDYLLGWQDDARALRYCHHTDEAEIDALAASVSGAAREIERYSADGRTGALNRYLILQRIDAPSETITAA